MRLQAFQVFPLQPGGAFRYRARQSCAASRLERSISLFTLKVVTNKTVKTRFWASIKSFEVFRFFFNVQSHLAAYKATWRRFSISRETVADIVWSYKYPDRFQAEIQRARVDVVVIALRHNAKAHIYFNLPPVLS